MTVPPKWDHFCLVALAESAASYRALIDAVDDETTPYASRYAAAEEQTKLIDAVQNFQSQQHDLTYATEDLLVSSHTILGRCLIRKGIALAQTDLTVQARTSLKDGLTELAQVTPCQDVCFRIMALNELGALLGTLGQNDEALSALQQAEAAFQAIQECKADLSGSIALLQLEHETTDVQAVCDELHTKTLFFLAQLHQGMGHAEQAAEYCGATLQRQASALGAAC
jgi:tetratricopeptide (TPR) repeat protein